MLASYIQDGPYRFQMQFERGTFAEFYGRTAESESILAERRQWLSSDRGRYLGMVPGAEALLREFRAMAEQLGVLPAAALPQSEKARAHNLGESLEPDFLLLKVGETGPRLCAGCVCFPSSWALEEKMGKEMDFIHEVVPGLNASLGKQISMFLSRLKPGISWNRVNWGLSRSRERNQHPCRQLPRLDETVGLEEVYFRVEKQSLVALPESGGVVFGIRIEVYPLATVKAENQAREKLIEALRTIPGEVAEYKGLGRSREQIISLLGG